MKVLFPEQLDRFPLELDRATRNAGTATTRPEADDVPYILNELEKRVGAVDSNDSASLTYRLARAEATIATLAQIMDASADRVIGGTLTGTQNGANTTFSTLSVFVTGTTQLYINGQRVTLGEDYTESGSMGIVFTVAPISTDTLRIDYTKD